MPNQKRESASLTSFHLVFSSANEKQKVEDMQNGVKNKDPKKKRTILLIAGILATNQVSNIVREKELSWVYD